MKTMWKVAVIAICLLIAQTVLMYGGWAATTCSGPDSCTVTLSGGKYTASVPTAGTPNPCCINTSTGPKPVTTSLVFTPPPNTDYTFYFNDNRITFNLGPSPPAFGTAKNITYSSYTTVNSTLQLSGTYENSAITNIAAYKYLKATTIINDKESIIQCVGDTLTCKIYGNLQNAGTVHVGQEPAGMTVEGNFSNSAYYDRSHFGGTLSFDIAGTMPCPMGEVCGPGTYSVLYVIPSTGRFRDVTGNGTATLSNKLVMNFVDGYTPLSTDKFHLISAEIVTGHFDSLKILVNGGTPPAGFPSLSLKNVVFDQSVKKRVPSTPNEAIKAIRTLQSQIAALNLSAFKNTNMKNALLNKLNKVIADIDAGYYADALDKLQNDILAKTDGCANPKIAAPDKNDWIINCTSQSLVYPHILEVRALLGTL
ncbi:MAG: hypothetical protein Q8912_16010 [Bacillota bacterium]|nr:hypothetical protein [Bacillota bacterium]